MKKLVLFLTFLFVWQSMEGQTSPTRVVRATFARPANATAYSANDVVSTTAGAFITFPYMGRVQGGSGIITGAILDTDTANVTNATFDLYLYSDTTSLTAIADHAVFTLLSGANGKRVCKISFSLGTGGTGSTSARSEVNGFISSYVCASYGQSLFGVLVATAAYTPALSGTIGVTLKVLRD